MGFEAEKAPDSRKEAGLPVNRVPPFRRNGKDRDAKAAVPGSRRHVPLRVQRGESVQFAQILREQDTSNIHYRYTWCPR